MNFANGISDQFNGLKTSGHFLDFKAFKIKCEINVALSTLTYVRLFVLESNMFLTIFITD